MVATPAKTGGSLMETAALTPFVIQAFAGAIGGNITGLIARGGGGLVGRTIIGAVAGVGAAYLAQSFPAVQGLAANWSDLTPEDPALSAQIAHGVSGVIGGGLVGLVTGLLIRQSK